MSKQINEAGKELVVDSIRILKGNGLSGAGAATIERRLSQIEQSVTLIEGQQNDYWSGIGEDNVITPIEKQTLLKEKGIIDAEKPSMVSRAEAAGITSLMVYDTYIIMYQRLIDMLNGIGIFDDMSGNTEIQDREAFNTAYTEYYEARDALQDAITKGYVSEGQGNVDRDAVPGMNLSANVCRVNAEHTVYTPSRITITGVITNGIYSDPYNCIFEIYRNGEEIPSVKTGITKIYVYDIPAGTESIRIVQKNVEGKLIYDDEPIHIFDDYSGPQLVLSNAFQTIINGTKTKAEANQVDLKSELKGYSNGYVRDVANVVISEAPSIAVSVDSNNVLHMTPEDEILESGTIVISADVDDPQILGIDEDLVIGIPELGIVIGQDKYTTLSQTLEYRNYDTLGFVNIVTDVKGMYLGPVADPQLLQNVDYGQYFLYTGDDTAYWQKGTLYLWNGRRWVMDFNNEHNTVAMKDMFTLLDSMPALANEFIHNLVASTAFIQQLFSKFITLQNGGHIRSENYNGTFNETTGAIESYGDTGWAVDSTGKADFVNMNATNSSFSGRLTAVSIDLTPSAGDVVLRKINVNLRNKSKTYYSQLCGTGSYRIKILNIRKSESTDELGGLKLSIDETGEVLVGYRDYDPKVGVIFDKHITAGQTLKLECSASGVGVSAGSLIFDFYVCTDSDNGILAYLGNYLSEDVKPSVTPR